LNTRLTQGLFVGFWEGLCVSAKIAIIALKADYFSRLAASLSSLSSLTFSEKGKRKKKPKKKKEK